MAPPGFAWRAREAFLLAMDGGEVAEVAEDEVVEDGVAVEAHLVSRTGKVVEAIKNGRWRPHCRVFASFIA